MKKSETNKILALILAVFPRAEVEDDSVLEAYHVLLGHLNFDLALLAVQRCLSLSSFEPKPADILRAAVDISATDLPDADTAWKQANQVPWSEPDALKRLNPIVREAVRAVGTLRDLQTAPVFWEARKQFMAAYRAARSAAVTDRSMSEQWVAAVSRIQSKSRKLLAGTSYE